MSKYTKLTNLEVTGDLKSTGTLTEGNVTVDNMIGGDALCKDLAADITLTDEEKKYLFVKITPTSSNKVVTTNRKVTIFINGSNSIAFKVKGSSGDSSGQTIAAGGVYLVTVGLKNDLAGIAIAKLLSYTGT